MAKDVRRGAGPVASEPWPRFAWPAILAAIFALVFHRFVGQVPIFRDSLHLFAPYKKWIAEGLASGTVYGWYPWQFLGMPFVANIEAGWFYPLNLVYLVLPFGTAHAVFILIHYPIAAATMAFLLRSRGLAHEAALVGAIAYALGGYLVCQHATVTMLVGAAWAPAAIAWGLRGIEGSFRAAIASGGVIAIQILGGDPQTAAVTSLIVVLAAVFAAARSRRPAPLLAAAVAGGSAFALAAAQILPTAELLRLSVRRGGLPLEEAQLFSLHPAELVGLVWPAPFGTIYPDDTFWGRFVLDGPYDNPWSITHYVGLPVLALAAFGLWKGRGRLRLAAGAGALAFLAVALGRHTPVYGILHAALPLFDTFRYPAKYVAGFIGCLSILAALGVEGVIERLRTAPARAARGAVVLAGASVVLYALAGAALAAAGPALEWTRGAQGLFASLAASATLYLAARRGWRPRRAALVFAGLAALDATAANVRLMPRGPARLFDERPAAAAALEPDGPPATGRYRIFREPISFRDPDPAIGGPVLLRQRLWERATLMRNFDAQEGFEDVVGYSASKMIDGLELLKANFTPSVMERFGVRYLLAAFGREPLKSVPSEIVLQDAARDVAILRLPGAGPRAYWTSSALRVRDEAEAIRILRDRTSRGHVVLTQDGNPASASLPPADTREATVAVHEPDRVVVEVDAPGPGWLVLNDRNYPGWTADVDGAPAPIVTADLIVRAVRVGGGRHAVTFRFVSWPIRIGGVVSVLAWAAAGAVLAAALRRRLRTGTIPPQTRTQEAP